MVDRAEANAKSSDFVHLLPLLTEPSTSDSSPVFIGELGVVVNEERTILGNSAVNTNYSIKQPKEILWDDPDK